MILLAFVPFKVYNKSNFRGRLIHRNINKWDFLPSKIGVDLYTSSTYTPKNTVPGVQGLQAQIRGLVPTCPQPADNGTEKLLPSPS